MSLTKDEIRDVIGQFLLERGLLKIAAPNLFDDPRWWTDGGEVPVAPYMQPVSLFSPVNRDVPSIIDGQGLNTKRRDMRNAGIEGAGALGAIFPIPVAPGEIWEIFDIFATFLCDGTVIARTANLAITTVRAIDVSGAGLVNNWAGTPLALTADQYGIIWMAGRHFNYLNTNGVVAATGTDENIFPLYMGPGSQIQVYYTVNGQVGDITGLDIYYGIRGQM